MHFKDYHSVHEMLCETVDKHSDKSAYRWFHENKEAESLSWGEFYEQVRAVSKSLMALGIKRHDKVNILSYSCYRWVLADMANMSIGVATVGIYQSNLAKDCQYIIDHSDAVLIFVEDESQLQKMMEIKQNIPNIRRIVLFNGDGRGDGWILSFEEFLLLGKDISDEAFNARTSQVMADDPAGIVYTSGTTGRPKGVVLTHDNITSTAQSVLHSGKFKDGEDMFLFLPLAHVFARTCHYTAVIVGNRTTFARSINTLLEDFQLAAPHWFISVPRIFEKIHAKAITSAEAKGGIALKLFNWACCIGSKVSTCQVEGKPIPLPLRIQHRIAGKLIFSKLHKSLGGNVKWCISGAAPLNPEIGRFFHAAGLLILEGLGMTENTSFSNVNRFDRYDFGVVGPPGAGLFHKIADDGEVLFSGRNVMKGYYKMPDETAETFTEDGWLKSGDIGEIDENNVLKITDRKKELIVTSGGKNIAPAAIEGLMTTSRYINQVCVVGEKKNYLTAIVTLNEENVRAFAAAGNIKFKDYESLLKEEAIVDLINGEVKRKNKKLPSFETIKKVCIVPEFTVENSMMTPTFKLKKNVIRDNYQKDIEKMYRTA